MEHKSNKELAIEAAIEFTKSWNSAKNTVAMKADDFIATIQSVYSTLCSLDND